MAIIKCKMCGGDLNISDESVAVCEYCGTQQTVPSADNEKKLTLFGRANRLRLSNEFDKAAGIYESIVAEFPEEAEAYWGLVLCRYGIEYVDDPATGKKIPTCHRSSFESVLEDGDFEQACENADAVARKVYREEAKAIEELRRDILEVSGKEEPYDIFICYKESDDKGERTIDSVIAQDVYEALTDKGYRVFFSRISLEDKLGTAYEPYIFAALNSAKVMLAFGTDYEYFNAVWVKNEWSRFLALIAAGQKKTLIPCYKGIDAYDLPKEFAKLQAQDMGKVGAVQDLLRGIDKILKSEKQSATEDGALTQQIVGGPTAKNLLHRGNLTIEDGNWIKAAEYYNQALDINAEYAEAYVGLLCVEIEARNIEQLGRAQARWAIMPGCTAILLDSHSNYKKAMRYGTLELQAQLQAQNEISRELLTKHFLSIQKAAETNKKELEKKILADKKKKGELESAIKRQEDEAERQRQANEQELEKDKKIRETMKYVAIGIGVLLFFIDSVLCLVVCGIAFLSYVIYGVFHEITGKHEAELRTQYTHTRRQAQETMKNDLRAAQRAYDETLHLLQEEETRLATAKNTLEKLKQTPVAKAAGK